MVLFKTFKTADGLSNIKKQLFKTEKHHLCPYNLYFISSYWQLLFIIFFCIKTKFEIYNIYNNNLTYSNY